MWARGEGPEGYDQTGLPIASSLVPLASRFPVRLYWHMSFRMAGGEWEPMLLGIEPRMCSVCGKGLYPKCHAVAGRVVTLHGLRPVCALQLPCEREDEVSEGPPARVQGLS